ncbi:MAG: STM4015 family protein [Pirellulales bacterium]|nr:STM4015 family protein [Pirellulales bacterium]
MYSNLLTNFCGLPVTDFNDVSDWQGVETAYRLRSEYNDQESIADRLKKLLSIPESAQLKSLIIGAWSEAYESGSNNTIDILINAAPKLPNLRSIFMGDITYEECEISWINQADMSPLLSSFPQLEVFRVRGGTGLAFSKIKHAHLTELGVETGGLSRSTIREIFQCDFPALEHLELLLGEPNYGFDGGVEDLQPLLSGKLFPKLKFLGLMNSQIANDIAAVVVNSPIVERIEILDLSMGTIDDEGIKSLLGLAECTNLKQLNVSHHYATPTTIEELKKALPFPVIADEAQDPNEEWRSVVHAE